MALLQWNDTKIIGALTECGRIALEHFRSPQISVKADKTPVTEADVAIEHRLSELFDDPDGGSYLIGEETIHQRDERYLEQALKSTAWIVDPIDGTASFMHGFASWGISIARCREGEITDGAIILPATGELFLASEGVVRYSRQGDTPERWRFDALEPLTASTDGPEPTRRQNIISAAQGVVKRGFYRGPESVHANGSCVYSVCYLARGSYSGYIADVRLWDIAAGIAILDALGFSMKFADGVSITSAVNGEQYDFDPGSARRFRFRDFTFFAARETTCDMMRENVEAKVI